MVWDAVFLRKYFFIYIFCMYQFVYGHYCLIQYYKYLRMDVKQYWRVILPVESYTPAGRPSFAPCIHWQQPWQKSAFAPIPLQITKQANPLSLRVRNILNTVLPSNFSTLIISRFVTYSYNKYDNIWALVYINGPYQVVYIFFLNTNTMYMVLYLQLSIDL